jgi:hypothetical protein
MAQVEDFYGRNNILPYVRYVQRLKSMTRFVHGLSSDHGNRAFNPSR